MNREAAFGRLLAIANILSKQVYEKGRPFVGDKYLIEIRKRPAKTFEKIHSELMEFAGQFDSDELQLMDMFGEILNDMDVSEFTNEPLETDYLLHYYKQQHVLESIIGVEEASELWGLSPGTIKNYCAEGRVVARKIGKTWIIDKNQPNPSQTKQSPPTS